MAPDHAELYRAMLRIRLVEERIADEYSGQEMRCPVHLSIGQEAAAVGVCSALRSSDLAVSGHRAHAHYLAKGGALEPMIAEMYGKATGVCQGRGGSMHLVDLKAGFLASTPIVGSTTPIGVGAAFAAQRRGEDRVVSVFIGEAATEEGVFHESVNFAAVHSLPVVFACENNLYSVYTPMGPRQPATRTVRELAGGHGIKTLAGDGNDVLEARRLGDEAVALARSGSGPVFIELATYRWREHCGPNYDNDVGYRTPEEAEAWMAEDPIRRSRDALKRERIDLDGLTREIGAEINAAFDFARSSPWPDPSDAVRVYA